MIRSLVLLVLLSAAWSHSSQAQSEFSAGLLAGFAATQVNGDAISGFHKIGLNGGAYVQFSLSDKFDGRIELTYIAKGSRRLVNEDSADRRRWGYTLSYIEVPLLLNYNQDKLSFQGGPYAAVLLNASYFEDGADFPIPNPQMRPFDIGVCAGASYDLSDRLFLSGRFTTSVISIRPPPDPGNQTFAFDGGMSNIVIQFTVGLRITS